MPSSIFILKIEAFNSYEGHGQMSDIHRVIIHDKRPEGEQSFIDRELGREIEFMLLL